jgi:pyruvate-formate lyase-activating enzyme
VANPSGEVYELEGYAAVGMAAGRLEPLEEGKTLPTPPGGEVMFLPDRRPVLLDRSRGRIVAVDEDPYRPGVRIHPVAVFNSPGYVATLVSAYEERTGAQPLPLFSYGAVGWHRGGFRSALLRVDAEPRQDLRLMPMTEVEAGIRARRRELPGNRLREHLETCAMTYGCPAAKNFFLGRFEAPLPASGACNARCLGCLSLQEGEGGVRASQDRIGFTPTPREIADVALAHLRRVPGGVVSFGQGCEGDPLLVADVVGEAIGLVRAATGTGTVHLNTNGSLPDRVAALFDAGLDSMRVSLNSVRQACYEAYFRPKGYGFPDVVRSIREGLERGGFVSLNYLNLPGFTDTPEETAALTAFLEDCPVHMIQWRNLNHDPMRYWDAMASAGPQGDPVGVARLIETVRRRFPDLVHGYFNPPKPASLRRPRAAALRGEGGP